MAWDPLVFDVAHALRPAADLEARLYGAIARAVGDPVLELGCGTARVLLAVLRAGIDIDGIELDPDMARVARDKLKASGLEPTRVSIADMTTFRSPRRYRLVTLPGNTLGSIDTAEALRRVFATAAASLHPGGEVAFDVTQVPEGERTNGFEAPIPADTLPDARPATYRQRVRFDAATATEHFVERIEFADGEAVEHRLQQRVWSLSELTDAFEASGLSLQQPPLDETGAAPSASSRLLFVRLIRG